MTTDSLIRKFQRGRNRAIHLSNINQTNATEYTGAVRQSAYWGGVIDTYARLIVDMKDIKQREKRNKTRGWAM